MKKQFVLFVAIILSLCAHSASFCAELPNECTTQHTPILFSQEGVDALITHLAQGNQVKNLTALNDITSMEQVVFAVQEVALMRAVGTKIADEKIEKFRALEDKLTQLISALQAAVKLNVAPTQDAQDEQHEQRMQELQEQVEQLLIPLLACRQIIAMCDPENIVQTVECALEIVKESSVDINIKKSFISNIKYAHEDNREIRKLCYDAFNQVGPVLYAELI